MALKYFEVLQGLTIDVPNVGKIERTAGIGAPLADAPIGSLYADVSTGGQYIKVALGAGAGNWKLLATAESVTAAIGTWRPERVVLATNDAQGAGVRDVVASPFSDDEGTAVPLSEYVVGKYILSDISGTPLLLEITDVTGNNVTFASAALPLVKDDTFVAEHYLPDSELQEGPAIVNYNGSVMVKIADADWGRADALALAPSYASQTGTITSADTVESAIEKLDGNLGAEIQRTDALLQAVGVNAGDTTLPDLTSYVMPMGTDYDSVLSASSAADDLGYLNYYVSQMINRVKYIDGLTWAPLLQIPLNSQDVYALKLFLAVTPPTTAAPVMAMEVHVVACSGGSGAGEVDWNVASKLKPATRNGVPTTVDYECAFRARIVAGSPDMLMIEVRISSTFGGNQTAVNYRQLIQANDFS